MRRSFLESWKQLEEQNLGAPISPEQQHALDNAFEELQVESEGVYQDIIKSIPRVLPQRRRYEAGFQARLAHRWGRTIDLTEALVTVAMEEGARFNALHRDSAANASDYQFDALTHLHARACLVAREILCLAKGGFADGALARWRTLHETYVVSAFLVEFPELALRYLASDDFQALRAAEQYKRYEERGGLEPIPEGEIQALKQRCAELCARYGFGPEMREDFGWASPVIGKDRPTLFDLEERLELDHWRPRYRWASRHNHAGHVHYSRLLGSSESEQPVLLAGPSNSGLADPLSLLAHTLATATSFLLTSRPERTSYAVYLALVRLAEEIDEVAHRMEEETHQAFLERRKRMQRKTNRWWRRRR